MLAAIFMAASGGLFSSSVLAETEEEIKKRVNTGAVTLITGGLEYASNTYAALARDMVAVLDEPNDLRLLPMMGHGALRNIEDMLYLRGVDIGMVHSDIMKYMELEGKLVTARRRLRFITKLYDEPFHVIASKEIKAFAELSGQPVAVGPKDSGADLSGRTFLRVLQMDAQIVNLPWPEAVEQLKSGAIAAIVYPTRARSKFIRKLGEDPALQLLSLPEPDQGVLETYSSVDLTNEDYPGFIPKEETRSTLQMAAILTTFNWRADGGTRYQRVTNFINKLFNKMDNLRAPSRHSVWRELEVADEVKGWERYAPAQKLVDEAAAATVAVGGPANVGTPSLEDFKRFMNYMRTEGGKPNASEQEFFDAYIKYQIWKGAQQQQQQQ